MTMTSFTKDPDAVLDYKHDWSAWLDEDTITESLWEVDSDDLTIDSDTKTNTATIVWLSGGVARARYKVTNSITTLGGRKDDRTFEIYCQEK